MLISTYILFVLESLSTLLIAFLLGLLGIIFFNGFNKVPAVVVFFIAFLYAAHPVAIYLYLIKMDKLVFASVVSLILLLVNVFTIKYIGSMIEVAARP